MFIDALSVSCATAKFLFNVNLWFTGLDTVVHSSCLMTISRLQFVAKSFPKLLRLTNICGRVFVDHCALCMMIMASIFLSGFGLGCSAGLFRGLGWVHQLLGWVGLGHRKWTHVHV